MPVKAAQHLLFLAQNQYETLDRWGYHIRQVHYYEPLPDFRTITREQIDRRREYPALDFNWQSQLDLVRQLQCYREELAELSQQFDFGNGFFGGLDASVYYSIVRHLNPHRIVEIGGGYSTVIAEKALIRNGIEGSNGVLTCIEPYPEPRLIDGVKQVEIMKIPVEDLEVEFFSNLEPNDILFIDSSHTVKFGSDVCHLLLEVVPTLKPGVWIHVHDIFFPHDYPAEWLLEKRLALNEQYLLEAFLTFNTNFSICLSNHWLSLDHKAAMTQIQPPMTNGCCLPSSFWFKRTAQ